MNASTQHASSVPVHYDKLIGPQESSVRSCQCSTAYGWVSTRFEQFVAGQSPGLDVQRRTCSLQSSRPTEEGV